MAATTRARTGTCQPKRLHPHHIRKLQTCDIATTHSSLLLPTQPMYSPPPLAGNSKPRIVQAIQSALPTTKSTTTTKKTTKANTSQPRAATRVTKPTTTTTTTVKKPRTKTQKLVDAVAGTGEKVKGDVLGKPGVKVRFFHHFPSVAIPRGERGDGWFVLMCDATLGCRDEEGEGHG
jgi:hypothetical protein